MWFQRVRLNLSTDWHRECARSVQVDNLAPEPGYTLARYNDPSTPSFFRRNEVLIQVPKFKLLDDNTELL